MIGRRGDPGRPRPVGRPAHQVHGPRRLGVREAEPGGAAQVERRRGRAPRSPPARRRGLPPARRRPTARTRTPSSTEASVSSGASPKSRPRAVLRRLDEGERVLGRRSLPGVGQRGADHLGDALGADDAGPAGRADRASPATTITLTARARCTPLVVVVFSAKRTSAWLASSTSTTQPSAPAAPAAATPCSTSSWAGITVWSAPCSATRLLAGVEDPHARARAPTGSRATPEPPVRAGPCRS